ncbi:MAG: thermonuclease family protein [Blastocatellia bacterium]
MKEYQGMLRVSGTVALQQFWPNGKSDADTLNLKVTADSFEFSPDPGRKPFRKTTVFQGATVDGGSGGRKKAIRAGSKVSVRLQGIDATELHIKADYNHPLKFDREFRQFLAETATTELHDLLAGLKGPLKWRIESRVDKPHQVFDKYGRMIGDAIVTAGNREIVLNHWLVEQGWAYPAVYNSMRNDEIRRVLSLSDKARKQNSKGRVWANLAGFVGPLDFSMVYRPVNSNPKPDPKQDVGKALMPKLFRRQVRYRIRQLNKLESGDFRSFLARQKSDNWVLVQAYLKNRNIKPGKDNKTLASIVDVEYRVIERPDRILFFEDLGGVSSSPNTLLDATGKPITSWF